MESDAPLSLEHYCREVEAHLCRKNDGHLIRIAGPGFERVSRWAQEGIPLKVACAGIDRYFERYYRRGPRRRPVRIEFCEADVLDAFDDWRRAVGVADAQQQASTPSPRARQSLATHIERTVARLTTVRASSQALRAIEPVLERVERQLDGMLGQARNARGATREELIAALMDLDRELLAAVVSTLDEATRERAQQEAQEQLAPFRDRMAPDAYGRATVAAFERFVREHFGVPTVSYP